VKPQATGIKYSVVQDAIAIAKFVDVNRENCFIVTTQWFDVFRGLGEILIQERKYV